MMLRTNGHGLQPSLHLLFAFFFVFFLTSFSDLAADRVALLRFRAAVGGQTLRWNISSLSPCSWNGVTCNLTINRVTALRLPGDGLSGKIPSGTVGSLSELTTLSLRRNSLSGALPSDLDSCTGLRVLNLQANNFSGEIPAILFRLSKLERLDLSGNKLSGELSPGFNKLTNLKWLYLENNQFNGLIPELHGLEHLNISFNRLTGSIPSSLNRFSSDSFLGNSLCGEPLSSCPNDGGNNLSGGAIAGIVVGSVVGLLLILLVFFIVWRNCRSGTSQPQAEVLPLPPSPLKSPENGHWSPRPLIVRADRDLEEGVPPRRSGVGKVIKNGGGNNGMVLFGENVEVFTLEDLMKASAEVLGKGHTGSTYKAYLESGTEIVVKRLKSICVSEKEFREKVENFGTIEHENLLPLRAYFYGRDEKLLLYSSMPISLSGLLHGSRGIEPLTWEMRRGIILGAARGIEYLHSHGPNFSHGNIKSTNILLTEYYDACVSEFCISQLVSSDSKFSRTGYHAPEVADSRKVSKKADVYSFGVLILEILTGKEPFNPLSDQGIDLPRYVQSVAQDRWTIEVLDFELLKYKVFEEQMVQLLCLAIDCTSQHPDSRPPMVEVTKRIKEICS